jgi:signal transduction histidine kinase
MKTGTKLLALYGLLAVVLAVVAAIAYQGLTGVLNALDEVADVHFVGSRNLAVINEAQTDVARAAYGLFNPATAPARRADLLDEVERALRRMHVAWERYDQLPHTAAEERSWRALREPWTRWEAESMAFLAATRARTELAATGVPPDDARWSAARERERERVLAMDEAYQATDPVIRELDDLTAQLVVDIGRKGEVQGRRAAAFALAGLACAFLFVLLVGAYLAWTIAAILRLEAWVRVVEEGSPGLAGAPRSGVDEVSSLAQAFWAMTTRQREAQEQLRALASRLQRVREEEKSRIARDLHDDLGQLLTGLKMDLLWLEGRIEAMPPGPEVNSLLERAVAAADLSDRLVAEVQRIATDLRPASLDRLGLSAALQQEARRFHERNGIACTASTPDRLPPHSSEVATALYRIAQEALTNVARHAQASAVTIRLEATDAALQLEVEDDGLGFDATKDGSLGLLGMSERASLVRGHLDFRRREPRGTTVSARVPLRAPSAPSAAETPA